ncbi:serine hydrolase domain-containing protein [Thermocatellispora tengchongensis]|uniref:serine hydrolase domain-containing protein n=1 Tax=Thermocatellispora tengchongensis TaxID=1073253 RepID=UPI003642F8ED
MLNRRSLLKGALAAPIGLVATARPASAVPTVAARGQAPTALAGFDRLMKDFMLKRGITCGQLAIAHKGKLVFARAYTLSTPEKYVPAVTPTSLFRLASVGKHITATAILRLAQDGRLNLGDPVTKWLDLEPVAGKSADPRLAKVTMWRLLQHTAGWDREVSSATTTHETVIARALGKSLPLRHADIMRYVTGYPLDFDPGTRMAYSNYGYLLLGRVIEKVTGRSYESYVRSALLTPLKIARMRVGSSSRPPARCAMSRPTPRRRCWTTRATSCPRRTAASAWPTATPTEAGRPRRSMSCASPGSSTCPPPRAC